MDSVDSVRHTLFFCGLNLWQWRRYFDLWRTIESLIRCEEEVGHAWMGGEGKGKGEKIVGREIFWREKEESEPF